MFVMGEFSKENSEDEIIEMKNQLGAFGFDDEDLSREEMKNLLKALRNSRESADVENEIRKMSENGDNVDLPKKIIKGFKRRYVNVSDRRLPWSLLPKNLTPAQRSAALATYIRLVSISCYMEARKSFDYIPMPVPIEVSMKSTIHTRSSRSGRTIVSSYIEKDSDDELNDEIVAPKKKRKRKAMNSDVIDVPNKSIKSNTSEDKNLFIDTVDVGNNGFQDVILTEVLLENEKI